MRDANVIAERLNRALRTLTFTLGGEETPRLQSVGAGVFRLKALGRTWKVTFSEEQ